MDVKYFIKALTHLGICFFTVQVFSQIFQGFMPLWIYKTVSVIFHFIFTILMFKITKKLCFNKRIKPENKAVLITGCDSGFGHLLAKQLDSKGFRVYATCLQPTGHGATELKLKSSENLKVLEMDVTKDESVSKAVKFIKEDLGSHELWAVVNNAGVFKGTSAELSKLQNYKDCIEVNLIGMVRVTKAFLPFLRKSKGRVVNIASFAGRMAMPYMTPYSVSKFAVVGFNECLRREMDVWGIRVISIEPELFRTPMTDLESIPRDLDKEFVDLDASIIEDYGTTYLENLKKNIRVFARFSSLRIFNVIKDLESAITLESPDAVYKTSRNYIFKIGIYILHNFPVCVQDMWIKLMLFFIIHPKSRRKC
ncbi:unnamed protein product [Larinioides sclopetarius]|uniref:Estradiol 17-beta-dehydrogenase 2 n=1 Tax=Larinioides sclopetarius TaxID=280406 RepID=A0AAV1Z701_9ARAC